jgi:hypothetical protein
MKKKVLLSTGLLFFTILISQGQEASPISHITKSNITIRPNSRDYNMVRRGNNNQRMIQIRRKAMMKYRKATANRKLAIRRKRNLMIYKMIRNRKLHQQMMQQRKRMIQQRKRMINR